YYRRSISYGTHAHVRQQTGSSHYILHPVSVAAAGRLACPGAVIYVCRGPGQSLAGAGYRRRLPDHLRWCTGLGAQARRRLARSQGTEAARARPDRPTAGPGAQRPLSQPALAGVGAAVFRRLVITVARIIRTPPAAMPGVGCSLNNHQAKRMPYTGSSAKITEVVRAFSTFRLATNRLCARPVQKTPSSASQSQSAVGKAGSADQAKGNRPSMIAAFCQSAACTGSMPRVTARLSSDNSANSRPDSTP